MKLHNKIGKVLFALMLLLSLKSEGQPRKLPPFRIVQPSGNVFQAQQLPMGKPIVLIYFSPDCDHCHVMMKDWSKTSGQFKDVSLVMITYLPVPTVAKFYKDYQLHRFPNVVVGTEGTTFFVRNYYNLTSMPFAALHDRNGNLVKTWSRDVPLEAIALQLKKLP